MATSSVQNEESTKVGVPSEAGKQTEPFDTFQMRINNLIVIKKLLDGSSFYDPYDDDNHDYDVAMFAIKEFVSILGNFQERLGQLGDCANYVDKLDGFEKCFDGYRYSSFSYSNEKQSELFFKLRGDNKNFQQLLEELQSFLTKKSSTFENAATDEQKHSNSIIKKCLKDVSDLKNISRYILPDHSTSVFIYLEMCLIDFEHDFYGLCKGIVEDFKEENTEKVLLQLQMSVKTKKELLLEDLKNQNVEEKTRKDRTKSLSEMEYFLESISRGFTGHSYAVVHRKGVSGLHEIWDFFMSDLYPLVNLDVLKRSVFYLKNKLKDYINLPKYFPSLQLFRRHISEVNFSIVDVETKLEDYQMDLSARDLCPKKFGKLNPPKVKALRNTSEKFHYLLEFLRDLKCISSVPTLLSIDLDKCLQFDDELLNYWNKLKQSSDDNRNKLLSLRSEIKERLLEEMRIAEKLLNLELSKNNDDCQGKALEVVD